MAKKKLPIENYPLIDIKKTYIVIGDSTDLYTGLELIEELERNAIDDGADIFEVVKKFTAATKMTLTEVK